MILPKAHEMAATLNVSHIVEAIHNARIETEPFNYFVCDNVFHPDDYANILSFFPDRQYFTNVAHSVSRLDLVSDPASKGKGEWDIDSRLPRDRHDHDFWYGVRDCLMNDLIMQAFTRALDIAPVGGMSFSARLAIDNYDAGLGPHTDRIDKLASGIFYLAEESEIEFARQAGTQVLTPTNKNLQFTQEHYKYSDFKIHEYVEYRPNRLFAFAVANGEKGKYSFHGYHQSGRFDRKTIKCHIHNPVLVEDGIRENEKYKATASDWLKEIKQTRSKD